MSNIKIYLAERVFTGYGMLPQHAVVVVNDVIAEVIPLTAIPADAEVIDYKNALIAPAFIDIQLYGAYKRLLSAYPDAETVKAIYTYSKAGGCSHCMPTVATHTYETIFKCVDAVRAYWNAGGAGVSGLHVEGPWISQAKRGAHNPDWIFSPSIQQAKELLEHGKEVIKIITLAPEVVSKEVIELIQSYNIIISAGHSNATYEQAIQAFSTIKTATHLYNAMSAFRHRGPGMAGAIFDHASVNCSIVPDGYHVSFPAIRIAKKIMGERLFAITDAVTETHEGYYTHIVDGNKYAANGILSGSALTMNKCVKNFVEHCNIDIEEALRMCSLYPAKILGKENELGIIATGRKANMVVLNDELSVVETICITGT
ncbi:N-acetylglucosamine-6-phosphate deacetylase [Parafilimonas sp.]|uniref:N-acetylglucosamine-6-phosphate deacetylase n=1 Tax=Parafilimonas sp. TaxID=1969739 RepID=UPI0039E5227F